MFLWSDHFLVQVTVRSRSRYYRKAVKAIMSRFGKFSFRAFIYFLFSRFSGFVFPNLWNLNLPDVLLSVTIPRLWQDASVSWYRVVSQTSQINLEILGGETLRKIAASRIKIGTVFLHVQTEFYLSLATVPRSVPWKSMAQVYPTHSIRAIPGARLFVLHEEK